MLMRLACLTSLSPAATGIAINSACLENSLKVIHVDPATGHQHVISSGGHLQAPVDIAVDANGKILVVDLVGDKLIRIEPTTGAQTVIAQGGLLAGIRSVEVFGK
jgi:streptogramin lyase